MAAIKPLDLDIIAFPRPPPEKLKGTAGFKYRGSLFRPSSATSSNGFISAEQAQKFACGDSTSGICKEKDGKSNKKDCAKISKFRRVQSAKGRLERDNEHRKHLSSSRPLSSTTVIENEKDEVELVPSVVNLNALVDVPDKEEAVLAQKANLQNKINTCKEFFHNPAMRPSSAKAAFGYPSTAAETKDCDDPVNIIIKPSVFGLRLGRHVFGSEPETMEAWANTEKEFPFRLKRDGADDHKQITRLVNDKSDIPTTLDPLLKWKREDMSQNVTGLDPKKCLIFLSTDYDCDELPQVPSPQTSDQDLPYRCVVATPRKQNANKYEHPCFDKEPPSKEWECSHTRKFSTDTHEDISFLLNPPLIRRRHEIRLEITELEDLLTGIGSLDSSCSFVKFQAEISRAQNLAKKLMIVKEGSQDPEPTDTFGLLKFYKEHDEIMQAIHERRNRCLEELAQLEESYPDLIGTV